VRVVDPARSLDLVLELGQAVLQLLEVLGGAELRVLLGDDPEAAQCLAQLALRLARLGWAARLHRGGACLSDLLEGPRLVRGIALDGPDQVGYEIVPALELDVDPAPGLVALVPHPDDAVAEEDVEERSEDDEREDH